MEDYQNRMLVEQKELSNKIVSLVIFITDVTKTEYLSEKELDMLRKQLYPMLDYDRILQLRLAAEKRSIVQ